ncbi:ChbG/HpnK family deacetylase [Hydrogenophilus thermoluteolus]|uniref:ChbG/HpnK family deacetylase n=1 Tax=Hydrogenophilus thermoluteolus TaxID=297 RepID=UPI003F6769A9
MTQEKEKVRNGETRASGRPIVLCADDFGLAPGVNDAIIELIAQGTITATSVMPGQPFWPTGALVLRTVAAGRAAVGWHVTLTEQQPAFTHGRLVRFGRLPPLKALLARAWTRTLPLGAVRDELTAQLDAFEDRWGAPPAFVDGHQHVHLLPGVREVLLELLLERYSPTTFWARDTVEPIAAIRARGVGVGKAAFCRAWGGGGARFSTTTALRATTVLPVRTISRRSRHFAPNFRHFCATRGRGRSFFSIPGFPTHRLRRSSSWLQRGPGNMPISRATRFGAIWRQQDYGRRRSGKPGGGASRRIRRRS